MLRTPRDIAIDIEVMKKDLRTLEMLTRTGFERGRLDVDAFLDHTLRMRRLRQRVDDLEKEAASETKTKRRRRA